MKIKYLLGLVLLFIFFSSAQAADQRPLAVAFSLPDLAGRQVRLADFRGKVVVLNFWASWCPPCRAEMPSLQRLMGRMKGRRFALLTVNLDQDSKVARDFLKQVNYTFPVLFDPKSKVAGRYIVTAYPTTFIIGKRGRVLDRIVGGIDWTDKAVIRQLNIYLNE
ncbi:MAG: TlpA family protein disulfide reductase [Candidatus Saganbacteria bacterium]|nr:TlpA family protein disulfide reductase [Candidatus Saganbacteria bacterium]